MTINKWKYELLIERHHGIQSHFFFKYGDLMCSILVKSYKLFSRNHSEDWTAFLCDILRTLHNKWLIFWPLVIGLKRQEAASIFLIKLYAYAERVASMQTKKLWISSQVNQYVGLIYLVGNCYEQATWSRKHRFLQLQLYPTEVYSSLIFSQKGIDTICLLQTLGNKITCLTYFRKTSPLEGKSSAWVPFSVRVAVPR